MTSPVQHAPARRLAARLRTRRAARGRGWTARQWAALFCVLSGYVVGTLTASGTAISLPSISAELQAGPAAMQWFVTGYLLATTCLVLIAGALGDRFGRRLVLRVAACVYTAGIAISAIAPTIVLLNVARISAGVGSAGLMACGAAVLTTSFTGSDRVKAFALCGAAGGIGMAIGPSAAGWIVDAVGWRGTFGVLAAASLLMVASTFLIKETRAEKPRPFDLLGAGMLIVGLSLLLLGISTMTSGNTAVGGGQLVGAAVVLTLFIVRALRVSAPLLELSLLRDRITSAWLISAVMATAGMTGFTVYLPTYLLVVHGLNAAAAGTWMLAFTIPLFVVPMIVSRWVNRGGSAPKIAAGCLTLAATAYLTFALLATVGEVWVALIPTAALGFAIGSLTALSDAQLMSRIDHDRIGMASGLLNTMRSGATSIVLALFGAGLVVAIAARVGPQTADRLATGDVAAISESVAVDGFGHGWTLVLAGNGVLMLAAAAAFVGLILAGRRQAERAAA
ncbi:MFS transporter [Ruania alba]|uniref:Predicted arabinose efflux permease, MFS family n=1 Tax=Ruania alba TaxID=648782 RepID=A0A1H5LPP2_9MICO|nr:MFS transporter [Ruania alba]SEE78974.1 Predicted arabinose efflux permease, MFS family [Ruania alba]